MAKQSALPNLRAGLGGGLKHLRRFGCWWQGELLGMVPPALRDSVQRGGRYLLAEINEHECVVRFGPRGNLEQIGRFEIDQPPADGDVTLRRIQQVATKADEVILLLPAEMILGRDLQLPAATEANLRNILGFELNRYTPFEADQVYYGYRLLSRDNDARRITVSLKLVPRTRLDPVLEHLLRWGIRPDVVAPAAEASGDLYTVNLLRQQPASRRKGRMAQRTRYAVLALLVALLVALPLWNQQRTIAYLQDAIVQPQLEAREAQSVSEKLRLLSESGTWLAEKKQQAPSLLYILAELTDLMPDHTWFTRFELKGTEVRIQGESGEASSLISLLDNSVYLSNARFVSPVTTNPRTEKERFIIVAQLRQEVSP